MDGNNRVPQYDDITCDKGAVKAEPSHNKTRSVVSLMGAVAHGRVPSQKIAQLSLNN